jgi:membrane-bound lytic murein transglycosylase B
MVAKSRGPFIAAVGLIISLGLFFIVSVQNAEAVSCTADVGNDRTLLLQQMEACNKEVEELNGTISGLLKRGKTYTNEIALLKARITKAQSNVKAKNVQISRLSEDITKKTREVNRLSDKLGRERESLAQLLRKTAEYDQVTLMEALLSGENISSFYQDVDEFVSLQQALGNSAQTLKKVRKETEDIRSDLEDKKDKELDAKIELERAQAEHQTNQKEQQKMLSLTKNKEAEFQKVLTDRKKKIAAIREALFRLQDDTNISFGQAYDFALEAEKDVGVRPAFLLAIFSQETNFGKFVGGCVITDDNGNGKRIKSGEVLEGVMAVRDIAPFKTITSALGKDRFSTPISCPLSYGYGGAMGAAQFIPSTWIGFVNRVKPLVGTYPNPWVPRHAFITAAMYLSDLGASAKTPSAERNAACKYYSGAACGKRTGSTAYGNSVLSKAEKIQREMIDPMNQ